MVLLSHRNGSEQFNGSPLCALPPHVKDQQWSAVPPNSMYRSEQLLRDVKAAASKRNNDLRVAREEAAANNDVAVESEDESDDE